MKLKSILLLLITIGLFSNCQQSSETNGTETQKVLETPGSITGSWVRIGHTGPIRFHFKDNGLIEADFGNDDSIDVVSSYLIKNDTIIFNDKDGQMCREKGVYTFNLNKYYLSFNLVDDMCNGRIKTTMGFWTRPEFKELIAELDRKISNDPAPDLFLKRARIFMATGKPQEARSDFDRYLKGDTTQARVYINRASTRFPVDMEGVVLDCNKAIALDSTRKNACFLRGLALYELGRKKQACEDFSKAINYGFSILQFAEKEKCKEYWDKK